MLSSQCWLLQPKLVVFLCGGGPRQLLPTMAQVMQRDTQSLCCLPSLHVSNLLSWSGDSTRKPGCMTITQSNKPWGPDFTNTILESRGTSNHWGSQNFDGCWPCSLLGILLAGSGPWGTLLFQKRWRLEDKNTAFETVVASGPYRREQRSSDASNCWGWWPTISFIVTGQDTLATKTAEDRTQFWRNNLTCRNTHNGRVECYCQHQKKSLPRMQSVVMECMGEPK